MICQLLVLFITPSCIGLMNENLGTGDSNNAHELKIIVLAFCIPVDFLKRYALEIVSLSLNIFP